MFSPASNLKFIDKLRTLRINTQDENNAAVEKDDGAANALNELNEIFNDSKLSLSDVEDDTSEAGSSAGDIYAICETVDDSLLGLYTLDNKRITTYQPPVETPHEYDWLLDGDLNDDGLTPKSLRRKRFGEPELDHPLEMMELEDPSLVTASCSPDSALDGTLESGEEIIEFANFENLDVSCIADEDEWGGFASAENGHDQQGVQFKEPVDQEIQMELADNDSFIGCVVDTSDDQTRTKKNETSLDYKPPQDIHQLVNNLDAELDITIDECLNTSRDASTRNDKCCIDDVNETGHATQVPETLHVPDSFQNVNSCTKNKDFETPKSTRSTQNHQQPLIMSSKLMETLPMPIPDMDTDVLASFTYRAQKSHRDALAFQLEDSGIGKPDVLVDDSVLESTLADTVHSGYFEGIGGKDEQFDSIVLDEVLNVPWPFYEIDLDEPIVENEYNELDPEEIDSSNGLNFDSYIFNRLSQLDIAKGDVMSSIISRVSLKEKSINAGTECILAAELDIATCLMYANSSRETVQRMLIGYPIGNKPAKRSTEHHNVIMANLNILDIADTRDRVLYLSGVIERISDISDQEVHFWKEIPNMKSHRSPPLRPEQYHDLIDLARKLYELTLEEEVLNHVTALHSLRDRIQGFSGILLECMEDSIADLIRRMLNADDVCSDEYFHEYETLVRAWISCCQIKQCQNNLTLEVGAIADGWSGCLLKALCFEVSKAYVFALIDTLECNEASQSIANDLDRLKCSLADESDIDKVASQLLNEHRVVSSSFSHQTLRTTEVLSVYCLFLEWQSCLISGSGEESDELLLNWKDIKGDSISSISDDDLLSSTSSIYETVDDNGTLNGQPDKSNMELPETFEIEKTVNKARELRHMVCEYMLKSMDKSIRHPLFTFCESKLTQSVESYASLNSIHLKLEELRMMENVFQQFASFSLYYLGDDNEDELVICQNIEMVLKDLYQSYLRSVHIEAMKTTGTLLRQESWTLSPLDFTGSSEDDEKKCDAAGNVQQDEQSEVLASLQHAILELLSGFLDNGVIPCNSMITDRAILHGHGKCKHFMKFVEIINHSEYRHDTKSFDLTEYDGRKELLSFVMEFVERHPQYSLPLMTQSSINGLVKWTARLLSAGITLPSIADDVATAVKTLFDLYIMTVFRICSRTRMNEDALIGLTNKNGIASKSMLSLTIEADICSPLHGEDLAPLQNYVHQGRQRLSSIVNLDKFEASDIASPRSKNGLEHVASNLEKEVAAAASCMFVALFADVVSSQFQQIDTEHNHSIDAFGTYAKDVMSMTTQLIRQACRLCCAHAISSKEFIFQIICVGRAWEDENIQEYSNSYVDDLHERLSQLWALLSVQSPFLPYLILKYTWDQIVRSAFYTLIEGFSKVTACSHGGRSLMSMDLNTLSDKLNPDSVKKHLIEVFPNINAPPASSHRGEGKQYVDAYIKVVFYPDEVLHQWITENHMKYKEDHMMTLVAVKRSLGNESERFWELLEESIRALYRRSNIS